MNLGMVCRVLCGLDQAQRHRCWQTAAERQGGESRAPYSGKRFLSDLETFTGKESSKFIFLNIWDQRVHLIFASTCLQQQK